MSRSAAPVLIVSLIMADPKPLVAAAFVCERILEEPGGIFSAIRIVDIWTLKAVALSVVGHGIPEGALAQVTPAAQQDVLDATQLSINALVMIKAGDVRGKHEMRVRLRNPAGKPTDLPQRMPVDFDTDDPATGANIKLHFVMPGKNPEGLCWIEILWDEELLTRIPLKLRREPQAPMS
jgi:methyl coenzyme M reductase subunit C